MGGGGGGGCHKIDSPEIVDWSQNSHGFIKRNMALAKISKGGKILLTWG